MLINLDSKLAIVVEAAEAKKAADIVALDFREMEGAITDAFLICSGTSERQVSAIAEHIRTEMRRRGVRPGHMEGTDFKSWILIDFGDLVVHVFLDEIRQKYRLEDLWHKTRQIYPGEQRS
ncbi:ribosome silencing factor [bacterium]|nr:ribosome silencing factor [candidate division CSSED10-310 bacterium]